MNKKVVKKISYKWLRDKGVPAVLIPGIIFAALLGWKGWTSLEGGYYTNKQVFPETGVVRSIADGDTVILQNGVVVRLLGIDAPGRGQEGAEQAEEMMWSLVGNKRIWVEYDRYQDDKYGRVLGWLWVECEASPKFLPADFMHKSRNESNPGLTKNPEGCMKGRLVQEELVKSGVVEVEVFKDRGELKYQERLGQPVGIR